MNDIHQYILIHTSYHKVLSTIRQFFPGFSYSEIDFKEIKSPLLHWLFKTFVINNSTFVSFADMTKIIHFNPFQVNAPFL